MNNQNETSKQKKVNLLAIVILIWFFGSVLALAYFSNTENTNYMLLVLGQLFFITGIAFMRSQIKRLKKNKEKEKKFFYKTSKISMILPPIIFILIGLGCLVAPIIISNPDIITIKIDWVLIMFLGFLSVSVLFGVALCNFYFKSLKQNNDTRLLSTYAEVIDLQVTYNDGKKVYAPIIKYTFEGKEYTYASNVFSNVDVPRIGSMKKIKINPVAPEEVYFEQKASIVALIMGAIFLIFPIMTAISALKAYFGI